MKTKSIIWFVAAFFFSFPALAKWEVVAEGERNTVFIDKSTMRVKGAIRKIWTMESFPDAPEEVGGRTYISVKSLKEYDCQDDRRRLLQSIAYSESFGEGNIVYTTPSGLIPEWRHVVPGSYQAKVAEIVCSLKVKRK